jgi:hypothetical protein
MPRQVPPSDSALVRYLLGTLPREDEERFDELSIVDPEFAERLRAIEHDLADAYVRGELSGSDRERWQQRHLISSQGLEDLQLAEALAARERRQAGRRPSLTFFWGLAAAAVVALVTVAAYLAIQRHTAPPASVVATGAPTKAPGAPAALPQPQRTPPAAESLFVALTLAPSTRSLAEPPTLVVPAGTSDVRLTLRLEPNVYSRYDVAIRDLTSSAIVWRAAHLEAGQTADGKALAVTIPAATLQSRRYLISVTGVDADRSEVVGTYPLTVVLE